MRYVAKQAREGINVSKTHPLAEASMLVVGLGIAFLSIVLLLVFLIDVSLYFISAEKEANLFEGWLPDDLIAVSDDDERLQEVQALVDRLVVHWPEVPYPLRVAIEESELANAMALPGGLIVVTQGLLDQVESENELAFVLGHELGHFKNRDHLRALGRGVVVSLFFATIMGHDAVGVNVADITLKGFSRGQESKADEFGLGIVNAEYGHVAEASSLFQRWDDEDGAFLAYVSYLSTHPNSIDRIRTMNEIAVENGWLLQGAVAPLAW